MVSQRIFADIFQSLFYCIFAESVFICKFDYLYFKSCHVEKRNITDCYDLLFICIPKVQVLKDSLVPVQCSEKVVRPKIGGL